MNRSNEWEGGICRELSLRSARRSRWSRRHCGWYSMRRGRERVQKYLTTERLLVPMTEAKAVARRGYDVLLPQLRALAKNAGPLCNPESALRATQILERQIEAIIAAAEKEYGAGGKAGGVLE